MLQNLPHITQNQRVAQASPESTAQSRRNSANELLPNKYDYEEPSVSVSQDPNVREFKK